MSEFWWGVIWLSLVVPLMFLWGFALWDLFSRNDLRGWEKALWAIAIVFLPLIGLLFYFIVRPRELGDLGGYPYRSDYQYRPEYERAPGPAPAANDIETIDRLHETGTLTDVEYDQLKERMSSQQRNAT